MATASICFNSPLAMLASPCRCLPLLLFTLCSCRSEQAIYNPPPITSPIVEEISAGTYHACIRFSDGTVRCWGYNASGQAGVPNPGGDWPRRPTVVADIHDAIQVSLGYDHSCVLLPEGTARCWGGNDLAQRGNGDIGFYGGDTDATDVVGLDTISQLSRGMCALLKDGTVYCWGDPYPHEITVTPAKVPGLAGATAVAAGGGSCAILQDKTVQCWGYNNTGQLGDGTTISRKTPTPVAGLEDIVEISLGGAHSCARAEDGTILCWGENSDGRVGGADPILRHKSAYLHERRRMNQAAIFIGFASCVTVGTGFETSRRESRRARYDSKSAHRPLRRTHRR